MVQYRQLLPEGEDFELECGPAPERCSQGMKERKDDRAHVRHATTNSGKTSMISRRMEFSARTGRPRLVALCDISGSVAAVSTPSSGSAHMKQIGGSRQPQALELAGQVTSPDATRHMSANRVIASHDAGAETPALDDEHTIERVVVRER